MNADWKEFLTAQGARLDDGVHFSDPRTEKRAALDGTVLCDLSHYGLIRARGPEAESFLLNQFCNDVREVSTTHSQLNGYCTPKGRLLTIFRLFRDGDDFLLRLPQEILEPVLKRLRMFILRTQVSLEEETAWGSLGLSGEGLLPALREALGGLPEAVDACLAQAGLVCVRVPGSAPRFEIHGEIPALKDLWLGLAEQATPAGEAAWRLLEIRAGLPEIYAATQEAFVPQMVNLQAIGGLSFKKGCYPGQEIVARMHYLGKLKRRMYLAHCDSDTAPAPGTSIHTGDAESAQSVGKVVQAETLPEGGTDLLAVIEIARAEADLHLGSADGPALNLRELPYPVELPQ